MKFAYLLPYASYHEARTNWRPLLYAKHFRFVACGARGARASAGRGGVVARRARVKLLGKSREGSPRSR